MKSSKEIKKWINYARKVHQKKHKNGVIGCWAWDGVDLLIAADKKSKMRPYGSNKDIYRERY